MGADETQARVRVKARAVVAVILCGVFVGIYLWTPGLRSPMPDLRADLWYYTTLERFESWGREGTIHIRGWIYNYGPDDANVTLHLWVSDGTKIGGGVGSNQSECWQSYYFPLGVIKGNGGKRWFMWESRYNPFDPTTAQFTYELISAALVRSGP